MDNTYKRELVAVWLMLVAVSARRDPALAFVLKLVGGARIGVLLKLVEQALAGRLYASLTPKQQEVVSLLSQTDWNFPEDTVRQAFRSEAVDG